MITEMIEGRVQFPGYTAAKLAAVNPVLLAREVVYESDTGKRKVGDGVTAWNNLPYEGGSSSPAVVTIAPGERVENAPIKFTKQGDVIPVFIDRYALGGPTEGEGNDYTALFMCAQVDDEQEYWVANCVAYSMSDARVMYTTIESGSTPMWTEIGGASSDSGDSPIPGYTNHLSIPVEVSQMSSWDFGINFTDNNKILFSELKKRRMFLDAELIDSSLSGSKVPVPISFLTVDDYWLSDNGFIIDCAFAQPSNGKLAVVRTAIKLYGGYVTGFNCTLLGSGLGNYRLMIRGVYIQNNPYK